MTYKQFLEKCRAATKINDITAFTHSAAVRHKFFELKDKKYESCRYKPSEAYKRDPKFDFIFDCYESGGVSVGSCWESSNPKPYTIDIKPSRFEPLNHILKELCPNITFLDYIELENLIESGEATDYEYYGNSTDYIYRFIKLQSVYDFLKARKWI
jgi:hypothetical protein